MKRRQVLSILIALQLFALPAFAAWRETAKSPEQTRVLADVAAAVAKNQKPVVVFDLDSTLYKNFARWAVIVNEFGTLKGIKEWQTFQVEQVSDSFDMLGVLSKDAKVDRALAESHLAEFKAFWTKRFFSNEYLKYDVPLPGAAAFVKALYAQGAAIVYITGRDEQNMRVGSTANLQRDGFPIDTARTALFMKQASNAAGELSQEERRRQDTLAKEAVLAKVRAMGTVVASFENEPATINLYFDHFHKAGTGVAVFLDTDMAPAPTATALRSGVRTISGFRL